MNAAAEKEAIFGLGFTSTTDEIRRLFETYREMYKDIHGGAPSVKNLAVARSVYVAETDKKAKEECEKHLLHQYRVLYRPSMIANEKFEKSANAHLYWASRLFLTNEDYDGIVAKGNHIAGSPETVTNIILEQQKELGFGTFLGLFRFGSLPHELVKHSMRLFAEEVMPNVRRSS